MTKNEMRMFKYCLNKKRGRNNDKFITESVQNNFPSVRCAVADVFLGTTWIEKKSGEWKQETELTRDEREYLFNIYCQEKAKEITEKLESIFNREASA